MRRINEYKGGTGSKLLDKELPLIQIFPHSDEIRGKIMDNKDMSPISGINLDVTFKDDDEESSATLLEDLETENDIEVTQTKHYFVNVISQKLIKAIVNR